MASKHAISYGDPTMGRMRTTAIANNKGGTGKTTTAINVAAIAAEIGYRTLLVDLDDQGSATKWLGHSPDHNADLVEMLRDDRPLDNIARPTAYERLELVRASSELADADRQFGGEAGVQHALMLALEHATPRDFVVVDCPGDLGLLTIMGLAAADDVLIPLAAGAMELDELPKLTQLIDKVRRRLNPRLHISGLLPCRVTMYGTHTSRVVTDVLDTLRLNFPQQLLSTVIHESTRHGEAFSAQKPINDFDPGGTGDREYRAVVEELLAPKMAAMNHG